MPHCSHFKDDGHFKFFYLYILIAAFLVTTYINFELLTISIMMLMNSLAKHMPHGGHFENGSHL
jgi:hypothetical protein